MTTLAEDGGDVLARLEAWVKSSEDRAAYRTARGRSLSAEHRRRIKEIADRLDALLLPEVTDDPCSRFQRLRRCAESLR